MLSGLFSPWPSFTDEEAQAVSRVLLSNKVNYWTGTEGRKFEDEFAALTNTSYAIALANGTVALDLALYGLKIGAHNGGRENDEVVVTPRSFIASVSAIVNAGARPVFADVDRQSQNITPETVSPILTENTRAILCVHLAGWPCDMDGFKDLTAATEIKLIEDCAQAHGAVYNGRPVGGLGDVAAWSFCQDKIMTTGGEGGMVTCDDQDLWKRMWAYKDHGKNWDVVYERKHPPGFRWLHQTFGTNWRLTEMQAVIGRIQVLRMPKWHDHRSRNADAILSAARRCAILRVPEVPKNIEHGWYKCYVFIRPEMLATGWNRDQIISEIIKLGVPCFSGSCSEMYLEKAFENTSFRPPQRLPIARELGETSLMFLIHPTLTSNEIMRTCTVLEKVCTRATRRENSTKS